MDNSHYRIIFDLDKNFSKNLSKVVIFKNLVENVVMCGKYSLTKFANFLIIVLRAEIVTILRKFCKAISSRYYNIFNQILEVYYF